MEFLTCQVSKQWNFRSKKSFLFTLTLAKIKYTPENSYDIGRSPFRKYIYSFMVDLPASHVSFRGGSVFVSKPQKLKLSPSGTSVFIPAVVNIFWEGCKPVGDIPSCTSENHQLRPSTLPQKKVREKKHPPNSSNKTAAPKRRKTMTLRVCVDGDVIDRDGGWRFIQQK